MIKTGIDIGSTTVKVIATDETGRILYSRYERHNAKAGDVLSSLLKELLSRLGDQDTSIKIKFSFHFVILNVVKDLENTS